MNPLRAIAASRQTPLHRLLVVAFVILSCNAFADGLDYWVNRNSGTANPLYSVCYGSGKWVAVGTNGTVVYSADGLNWSTTSTGHTSPRRTAIAYGTNRFVVIDGNLFYSSTNILNWTSNTFTAANVLTSVIYANNTFVAVGSRGAIYASTTGTNWTDHSVSTNSWFTSVAYGRTSYVGVGVDFMFNDPGYVYSFGTSLWTTGFIYDGGYGGLGGFTSVCYASSDPRPFATGPFIGTTVHFSSTNRLYFTSSDGQNWLDSYAPIGDQLAYGDGVTVAVGTNVNVATSIDSTNWSKRAVSGYSLYGINFANHIFTAVGASGKIIQASTLQPSFSSNLTTNGLELTVSNGVNGTFYLQKSDALQNWSNIKTIVKTQQVVQLIDSNPTNPSAFYRMTTP